MSDTSSDAAEKPIKQPNDDLSKVAENHSVTPDEKSSPNLSDMPLEVVGLVIERSDYKEQLILRKVSKSLRSLVDQKKPTCTSLKVTCKLGQIICDYSTYRVAYALSKVADDLTMWERYDCKKTILRTDFEKVAFDDLAWTLKNPKLQLESFSFCSEEGTMHSEYLKDVLKSLNHQLSVREYQFYSDNLPNAFLILPYLKPGLLEKITATGNRFTELLEQIALLDQWKQAEKLELGWGFEIFPLKYATHFKRFHFNEYSFTGPQLVIIRNWLAKLDSFEYCLVDAKQYINAFVPLELCAAFGEPAPPNERTEYVSHYSISNSEYYLEFMLFYEKRSMTVEKKKKRSNSGF